MNGPEPVVSASCCADRQLGDALGHDEQGHRGRLGERLQHQAERLIEHDAERALIDGRHLLGRPAQQAAQRVLVGEALDRGQHVGRSDRLAVVPSEAVAQLEGPGELIVAHRPALDHLRLDLELAVEREQRVVDQVAVVAHDVGSRPDRIEDLQIRVHDHPQRLVRLRHRRSAEQQDHEGEKRTTQHGALLQTAAFGRCGRGSLVQVKVASTGDVKPGQSLVDLQQAK